MAERHSNTKSPEQAFDEIARNLYAVRPDDFTKARDEAIRTARGVGEKSLAQELGQLKRPTQSAWLINMLWRDQTPVLERLLALSNELSKAQTQGDAAELRRLTAERRELESTLMRRVHQLADEAGVSVSTSMDRDVSDTLTAAVASPEVANEVRSGRLIRPLSYAGFGTLTDAPLAPISDLAAARQRRKDADKASKAESNAFQDRIEQEQRRIQDAQAAVDAAAAALSERDRAVDEARQERERAVKQLEELDEQRRQTRAQVATAERVLLDATRRRSEAEKVHKAESKKLESLERKTKD